MDQIFSPEILGFLVFALVLFVGIAITSMQRGKKIKMSDRIQFDKDKAAIEAMIKELENEDSIMNREDKLTWLQKKQRELTQSNSGITLPVYISIMIFSMMVAFLIVYKIMASVLIALPFCLIGIIVPDRIVKYKVSKNIDHFNEQLVKALRRMASVMRAGGSLKQALIDVTKSRSMPMVIRVEFKQVLTDIEYGDVIEAALYKLYERTGSSDVQQLAVAVEIQRQSGGNIAQTFDTISANINNRNLMESDVKATLSQANTTASMLSILPLLLGGVLYLLNPTYYSPMFQSFTGRCTFLACVLMIISGMFIIKKISKIKM